MHGFPPFPACSCSRSPICVTVLLADRYYCVVLLGSATDEWRVACGMWCVVCGVKFLVLQGRSYYVVRVQPGSAERKFYPGYRLLSRLHYPPDSSSCLLFIAALDCEPAFTLLQIKFTDLIYSILFNSIQFNSKLSYAYQSISVKYSIFHCSTSPF